MPTFTTTLASKDEKNKLGKFSDEIGLLRREIALTRSALSGNRKSISSLTGGKISKDDASLSTAAPALRDRLQNLERQLRALETNQSSFLGEISSRKIAKDAAVSAALPPADRALLDQAKASPDGLRQQLQAQQNKLLEKIETGASREEALLEAVKLRQYAAALDFAAGEGSFVKPQDQFDPNKQQGPGLNERQAIKFIGGVVPKFLSDSMPEPAGLTQEGPGLISSVPTEAEERSAGLVQQSMSSAAPVPEPVPNVPGEGLADTLQRIAPGGGNFAAGEGRTALNSGQGPMTAPAGQQLVFRSVPGGQIEAGTTPIGTPGSQQFSSAFTPNQELTQRIQGPVVGEAAPGQPAPPPPPAPVEAAPAAPPSVQKPAAVLGHDPYQIKAGLAKVLPPGKSLFGGPEPVSQIPQGQTPESMRAAGYNVPPPAPSALGQPAQPAPEQPAGPDPRLLESRQIADNLFANGKTPEEVQRFLAPYGLSLSQLGY